MESPATLLSTFRGITLDEMDRVNLMERYDRKYVFHVSELAEILHCLKDQYRVLEVNRTRLCTYDSLYFDTPDLQLYHCHQSGRGNRFKIRFRKYIDSEVTFFELKVKTNRERTVKYRIRQPDIAYSLSGEPALFLQKRLPVDASKFFPQLKVAFQRITLVHQSLPERATIDINLTTGWNGTHADLPHLVIAEVKQNRTHRSPFATLLKERHIREGALSKYCLGILLTYPDIRKNNFKSRLLKIQKIEYDLVARPAC